MIWLSHVVYMYMYISQAGCAYSCMYIHPEKCDFMRRRRASAKCAQWQESERMFSCWVHHFWRSASSPNVCPADIVVTWVLYPALYPKQERQDCGPDWEHWARHQGSMEHHFKTCSMRNVEVPGARNNIVTWIIYFQSLCYGGCFWEVKTCTVCSGTGVRCGRASVTVRSYRCTMRYVQWTVSCMYDCTLSVVQSMQILICYITYIT